MITDGVLIYLAKVNIALVVFYLFYRLLFSRDTFFTIRRVCLLSILFISLLYPMVLLSFETGQKESIQQVVAQYAGYLLPEVTVGEVENTASVGVLEILLWGYCAVMFILFGRILIQLFSIFRLAKKGQRITCLSVPVISLSGHITPFSFFGWIFVNPSLYGSDDLREIMTHEKTHATQLHSWDVMIAELFCVIFWINPAVWLLKQEIRRNLEFLADKHVVYSGFDRKAYQYHLLRLTHPSAAAQIVNKFNVSPLKKRIMMMNKKRTSKIGLIKYALLLPLTGLLIMSSNVQAIVHLNIGNDTVKLVSDSTRFLARGFVVDKNDQPIPGFRVQVRNSSITTYTSGDGAFTISVSPGTELEFVFEKWRISERAQNNHPMLVKMPLTKAEYLSKVSKDNSSEDVDIFAVVEDMPRFPGGDLSAYLRKNVKYPEEAQAKKIQGKVFVQFIIEKDGKVTDVKVARPVDPYLDAEAVRVVKLMPDWKPGMQRGKPVRVSYTIPINFQLPASPSAEAK